MRARPLLFLATLGAILGGSMAWAQRFPSKESLTVVVGEPPGPSPEPRVDGARSAFSRVPLPTGTLRVAWRVNLSDTGSALALGTPLVDDRGSVVVVTPRGDVFFVGSDGTPQGRVAIGQPLEGPAALLSDGTVVTVARSGDVIGVRGGGVRFRARVGADPGVAPLALDDGGFVVAARGALVSLDATGETRIRARVDDEDPMASLTGPRATSEGPVVYATSAVGAVYAWSLAGARETSRVASFGGAVDGEVALVRTGNGAALLSVVERSILVAIDPDRGTVTTRAAAATVGALDLLGPPAVDARGNATVLALASSRTLAVTFDPAGTATVRQAVAPTLLPLLPDGGAALGPIPGHVGPLVDARGTIAFALPTGEVGALSSSGSLDMTDKVCGDRPSVRHVAGVAPAGPGAVVVACEASYVVRVESVGRAVP